MYLHSTPKVPAAAPPEERAEEQSHKVIQEILCIESDKLIASEVIKPRETAAGPIFLNIYGPKEVMIGKEVVLKTRTIVTHGDDLPGPKLNKEVKIDGYPTVIVSCVETQRRCISHTHLLPPP